MFAANNQISGRQTFRLLTYDILGIGTLLLPTVLAKTAGRDGIFCILAGVFLAFLYLKILSTLTAEIKESYVRYLQKHLKYASVIFLLCYFIYFLLMASYASNLLATLIDQNLVENVSFYTISFLILLLTFYGMAGGIEGRARVYEILFWFLMIPLFLMMLAACREVDTAYWSPVFLSDTKSMITGSYDVLFCYSLASLVLFLKEFVAEKPGKLCRSAGSAILFSGIVFGALYLLLEGMFGSEALAAMQFPAVTMMSRVQVTGGFLKRTDAFMIGIWFFTLYALLGSMVFYSGNLMRNALEKIQWCRKSRLQYLPYGIVLTAVYALTIWMYRSQEIKLVIETLLWKAATPFVILFPVLLLFFCTKRKKKKMALTAAFLLTCLFMQGCNVPELENREFPLYLAVRSEGDFQKLWLNKERSGGKVVDYNHLKVLLIERSVLEDEAAVNEMLTLLKTEQELPQNTYVIATENCEEILTAGQKLPQDVGTYLEQLIEQGTGVSQDAYPTIGMLYQEQENHLETFFIPCITLSGEEPVISSYEVWKRGSAAGLVDSNIAYTSFFTQNKMEEYALQLAPGQFVKVNSAYCNLIQEEVTTKSGKSKFYVKVTASGDGEILSGETQTEQINGRMEDYLNQTAANALAEQIDITNSFKKLGENDRIRYLKYQNAPAHFEQEITIQYTVKINWKKME